MLGASFVYTCKSADSASLEEPGTGVAPIVLVLEVPLHGLIPVRPVEGVPPDPHTDVGRHCDPPLCLSFSLG
jgi:hypothetical protein